MKIHAIAIHGGAEVLAPSSVSLEKEEACRKGLEDALLRGNQILTDGGAALDAVEAAVKAMELNPLFNAGKGSVFTKEGRHELDAAIMCGKTLKAGAVAGIRNVKHPISLARAVMENTEFILLTGQGAEAFARERHFKFEQDDYFFSQEKLDALYKAREAEGSEQREAGKHKGTVGAVALDVHGNLAAATSTGGLTNKRHGRIGDSPLIGCGTYANNAACAVSCTGDGEAFIRTVAAYDVNALMQYRGLSLKDACTEVIQHKLKEIEGEGGLIAVDKEGNIEMVFNSQGMFRGMKRSDGPLFVEMFKL